MTTTGTLEPWGWTPAWQQKLVESKATGARPARIVRQERDQFFLISEIGNLAGIMPGNFRKYGERPVTGDWVAWSEIEGDEKVLIEHILPRSSELARQAAGEQTRKQVIAANVDLVLIVMGLDGDFNVRRLERYLRLVSVRGIDAAIILNKSDQVDDISGPVKEIESIAERVPVFPMSAKTGEGMDALQRYLQRGNTLVVVGSSGVGKSTIINTLMGEELLATNEVREGDDRGRHTTTQRELILLPSGALMIDTPGIRELSEWQEEEDEGTEDRAFSQIEELSLRCKFNDCSHRNEPGCAVIAARERGEVDDERIRSWQKLQSELKEQAKRQEEAERLKSRQVRGRSRRIQTPKKR